MDQKDFGYLYYDDVLLVSALFDVCQWDFKALPHE